jgi:hypothetical protein
VLYGGPSGPGTAKRTPHARLPTSLAAHVADVNGDGRQDVLTDPQGPPEDGMGRGGSNAGLAYGTKHGLRPERAWVTTLARLYQRRNAAHSETEAPGHRGERSYGTDLRDLNGDGRAEVVFDQLLYDSGTTEGMPTGCCQAPRRAPIRNGPASSRPVP